MPVDLIIYIVIAVILVFWLRNTLGTRNGAERERPNPLEMLKKAVEQNGKIIDITDKITIIDEQDLANLRGVSIEGENVGREILDLIQHENNFNIKEFINGAREAFPIIIEAFAKTDLRTLKDLLSPNVYNAFEKAIEDRLSRGEIMSSEIHAVKSVKVMGIKRNERLVLIKLRFEADETCVIRDRDGNIISGNPDRITQMNDVWTFGRDMRSKDPTWLLYETSDDVVEEVKTQIPDTRV